MAISQSQKVDFLYKKLGFTKTKTGLSVDGTISGTKKAGFGEQFASPLIIADGSVWNQSELIPTTPPASDTSIVKGYRVATALRMTVDPTVAGNRSYIAYTTFNNTSSARLTNWIDTQFGNDYVVKVYAGDPNSGGTLLPAGGSTGSDSWFFDYSSGVLQFHDTSIHSSIDSNGTNVYIVGYRYIGQTGVISIGDDTNFGDLTVNNNFRVVGLSTFVDAVNLSNNLSVAGITTLAGLSTVTGHTLFTRQLSVSGVSTYGGNVDINANLDVSGISTFNEDVIFKTSNTTTGGEAFWDFGDGSLRFNDISKIKFGNSYDFQIYHHNNENIIASLFGSHPIKIKTKLTGSTEDGIVIIPDGAVELYHDNGIRFETTGIGVSVLAGTGNTATIAGPQFLILDPDGVGVNTGVVRIKGDLIVEGEQTIVKSTELEIADFIVGIASTATTDALADGAGFKIGPDNTLLYEHNSGTNPSLKSSENLNVATGKVYQIAETERLSASKLSLGTGTTIHAVGTNILSIGTGVAERVRISDDGINVVGISTFSSSIDANGNLDVAGISTFGGNIDANGIIEGIAGENKIPSLYANYSNLPNAGSYHGMFAHVHATQKGYFAHGGAWYELVNRKLDGTVGTGTDSYNVGVITATQADIGNGGLDVDGQTDLDHVSISGLTTATGTLRVGTGHTFHDNGDAQIAGIATVYNKLNIPRFYGSGNPTTQLLTLGADEIKIFQRWNGSTSTIEFKNTGAFIGHPATGASAPITIQSGSFTRFKFINSNGGSGTYAEFNKSGSGGFIQLYGKQGGSKVLTTNNNTVDILQDFSVTGISTFTGNIDANGDLDVDGHTELDNVNIAGVTTVGGHVLPLADANYDLGSSTKQWRNLYVSNLVTAPGGPGFAGSNLSVNNLSVLGISTFTGNIDANGGLDVAGTSTLNFIESVGTSGHGAKLGGLSVGYDNLYATIQPITGDVLHLNYSAGTEVRIGASSTKVDLQVNGDVYPKASGNRDLGLTGKRWRNVYGTTFIGNGDFVDIDVDGHTELDNLNVAGVSTFSDDVRVIDDKKLMVGNSGSDLYLKHISSSNYSQIAAAPALYIQSNDLKFKDFTNGDDYINAVRDGSVDLYYNNTKRFSTSGVGATVFGELDVTGPADIEGNLTVGVGGTTITTVVGAAASVGIGDASPSYMLDVAGAINSQTDVKINGVSVTEQALNDAVAMAIALG